MAAIALSKQEEFETKKQAKTNIKTAICAVAELLANTPAVCRKCYVHPAVIDAYLDGSIVKTVAQRAKRVTRAIGSMTEAEAVVLGLLQRRLARKAG